MKFAIGYQILETELFSELVADYQEHVEEVYFPWLNLSTGRASIAEQRGYVDWEAQRVLEQDLKRITSLGIKLDLLLNGNCYGAYAVSTYLERQVVSIIDYLHAKIGNLDIVTTASPAMAFIVKQHFPEIEVRASVNMRIGTIKGIQYVSHLFDSFHIQREYNRVPERLDELKAWADSHGKKLAMLVNSGCLNFCSGQTFHDNCVAHEKEIDEIEKLPNFNPHMCWNYLQTDPRNVTAILQSSWIRPEDLHHYKKYGVVFKLATRMHDNPRMVIHAYASGSFHGNLLDLFEPGFSPLVAPNVLLNDHFPSDWFHTTTTCNKECHKCLYCEKLLDTLLYPSQ